MLQSTLLRYNDCPLHLCPGMSFTPLLDQHVKASKRGLLCLVPYFASNMSTLGSLMS